MQSTRKSENRSKASSRRCNFLPLGRNNYTLQHANKPIHETRVPVDCNLVGFECLEKAFNEGKSESWCVVSIGLALRSGTAYLNVCFSLSKIAKAEELKGASDKEKEGWDWDGNVPMMYKVRSHFGAHPNLLWFGFADSIAWLITDQGWEKHLADETITSTVPRQREISRRIKKKSWLALA